MIYEPFYDMNVLLSADAVQTVSYIAGGLIAFHVLFALLAIYFFIFGIRKKSTLDSKGI